MNKLLYDKYKVKLSDKLMSDILEATIAVYGESHREQFERNMKKIQFHTKIDLDTLKEIMQQKLSNELIRLVQQYQDAYYIENDEVGFDFQDLSAIDYMLQSKEQQELRSMSDDFADLFGEDLFGLASNNPTLLIRNGNRLEFNQEFPQTEEQAKMIQRIASTI